MGWRRGCCCGPRDIPCSVCAAQRAPSTIEAQLIFPNPDFNDLCATCQNDFTDSEGNALKFVLRRTGTCPTFIRHDLLQLGCTWCIQFPSTKGCLYNWLIVDLYRALGGRAIEVAGILVDDPEVNDSAYYLMSNAVSLSGYFICENARETAFYRAASPSDNCRSGANLRVGFPTLP